MQVRNFAMDPNNTLSLETLRTHRAEILRLAEARGAINVRVFGSVARGEARPDSDVDFLVDFRAGTTVWNVVGLWRDLGALLGRPVNVVGEEPPTDRFMATALQEAVPL